MSLCRIQSQRSCKKHYYHFTTWQCVVFWQKLCNVSLQYSQIINPSVTLKKSKNINIRCSKNCIFRLQAKHREIESIEALFFMPWTNFAIKRKLWSIITRYFLELIRIDQNTPILIELKGPSSKWVIYYTINDLAKDFITMKKFSEIWW